MKSVAAWLVPDAAGKYGVLPALLVVLTIVTGIVDAVSFLGLEHVFVANMTGNVVFVGFALAGEREVSLWASAVAITSFALGAWITGRLAGRVTFAALTAAHLVLVVAAMVIMTTAGSPAVVIVLLAAGMGLQNARVRRAGVPDLTTTVLTTTLTGLAADAPGAAARRRLVSIVAMFTGALAGATLHLQVGPAAALMVAALLLAGVVVRSLKEDF